MTGWGRSGPLADRAGHDINYLAVAGALGAFGRAGEPPVPPLSIIADLGAGGLLLAYGIACALFERATSGAGQVVDAAMLDGTALFMGPWFEAQQAGTWNDARGTNNLDSGAPYYDSYRCADGEYVAVGALEPQFYARLLEGLDLDAAALPDRAGSCELGGTARALRRPLHARGPATSGPTTSRAWMRASRPC